MFTNLLNSIKNSLPYWMALVLLCALVFFANAASVTQGTVEVGNLRITRFVVPATASATDALQVYVGDGGIATVSIFSGSETVAGTWKASGVTDGATFALYTSVGNADPIVWQKVQTAQVSNASNEWYFYGTAQVDVGGARAFKVDVGNNSATQVVEIGVLKTR